MLLIINIFKDVLNGIKMIATLGQYKRICGDVIKKYTAKLNKSFKTFFLLYMVIPER